MYTREKSFSVMHCGGLEVEMAQQSLTLPSSIGSFTYILQPLSVVMRLIVNRTFIAGFYSLS